MVCNLISDLKASAIPSDNFANVLGYNSQGDGGGGDFCWDSSDTVSPDNGGTVLISSADLSGRWKRLYSGPVNVKWFGTVGNGVTNDTMAIGSAMEAALEYYSGTVIIPQGKYLISDLQVKPGINLFGVGGCTYSAGKDKEYISDQTSKFIVASNSSGLLCQNDDTQPLSGGGLSNLAIEGIDDTSKVGLVISGVGWRTENVSVNSFTHGVGVQMGESWRASHINLQIRRCGVGLYIDGSIGPINGIAFTSLLIENCRIGILQSPASTGSWSNSFVSPIIEAIGGTDRYFIPDWVDIRDWVYEDTNSTIETLVAGVIMTGACEFGFYNIYTEAIGGRHIYVGTDCSLTVNCGIMSQYGNLNWAENGYTGSMLYTRNGSISIQGTRFQYVSDLARASEALFVINIAANSFSAITFKPVDVNTDRPLYAKYQSTINYPNRPDRYETGIYQQGNKILGLNASDVIRSNSFSINRTLVANTTGDIIELAGFSNYINLSRSYSDGIQHSVILNYTDASKCIQGHELKIFVNYTNTNGSSFKLEAGANISFALFNLENVISPNSNNLYLEFHFENTRWNLVNYSETIHRKYGSTSQRSILDLSYTGFQYFDTTLNKPIYWNGSAWVDSTGVVV